MRIFVYLNFRILNELMYIRLYNTHNKTKILILVQVLNI